MVLLDDLTTFQRPDYLFGSLRAEASGFLLKTAPSEELGVRDRVQAVVFAYEPGRRVRRAISGLSTHGKLDQIR